MRWGRKKTEWTPPAVTARERPAPAFCTWIGRRSSDGTYWRDDDFECWDGVVLFWEDYPGWGDLISDDDVVARVHDIGGYVGSFYDPVKNVCVFEKTPRRYYTIYVAADFVDPVTLVTWAAEQWEGHVKYGGEIRWRSVSGCLPSNRGGIR